jgi:uncharacterized protein (TIGR03437 family)
VKQHLTVRITDAAQSAWGFQLTARSASDPKQQAGAFTSTDGNTLLMCASTDLSQERELEGGSQVCPANMPLQFIEHSRSGYTAQRGRAGSGSFEFDWMPPATASGNITFYVAGNAANGDLTNRGDHIYTATFTLTPATGGGGGSVPTVSSVENGGSYQPGIAAGSWVTIKGTSLASIADPGRTWRNDEIVDGKLPQALDNVRVTINNKPAFVYFISQGQINVQAPDDTAQGPVDVVVNNNGTTARFTGQLQPYAPGFFQWGATKYAITTRFPDNAFIGNPSAVSGTVAAKAGDVLILWGTGFGPTTPAVPAGQVVTGAPTANTAPVVRVGGTQVEVIGVALSPGSAGLYQIAIRLPASLPTGDQEITAAVGGFTSATGVNLFIQ